MLSLYSANLASPNWPLVVWLILSKGRCLAQSYNTLPGMRGRLGEMPPGFDPSRIDLSRNWTAWCIRQILGEVLMVCSMKHVQTLKLCLSEAWKWSESEVLSFCNTCTESPPCGNILRNGVWREHSRQNEMRKKRRYSACMLKLWSRFRDS